MSQETYELIHNEAKQTTRLEANGDTIWISNGDWLRKDDDFLTAILNDANFGQPQKDALMALVGLIPNRNEDAFEK